MILAGENVPAVPYDVLAPFYDAVNGEPEDRIHHVLTSLARYAPSASSVLELGCGTGAVLAGLGSGLSLTGVDLSVEMLDIARRRCPTAHLLHADITSVDLGETVDAVICVYDTLNHVPTLEGWWEVCRVASRHLSAGGLFILDLNTVGRFRELGDQDPWVYDFDGRTLIMSVDFSHPPVAMWDIRVFEPRDDDSYRRHHVVIPELAVEVAVVHELLSEYFEVIECRDPEGYPATDESSRALVCARRRAGTPGA